ncbi:hypothetical protein ABTZ03_30460 [Kitasatospora sp. NPDC096077]|uniref:hypothetical protein n=1 Tax=Kitasatospora sp. NPDC096077 TaxID=3155544 RepID=UPI00331F2BEC
MSSYYGEIFRSATEIAERAQQEESQRKAQAEERARADERERQQQEKIAADFRDIEEKIATGQAVPAAQDVPEIGVDEAREMGILRPEDR